MLQRKAPLPDDSRKSVQTRLATRRKGMLRVRELQKKVGDRAAPSGAPPSAQESARQTRTSPASSPSTLAASKEGRLASKPGSVTKGVDFTYDQSRPTPAPEVSDQVRKKIARFGRIRPLYFRVVVLFEKYREALEPIKKSQGAYQGAHDLRELVSQLQNDSSVDAATLLKHLGARCEDVKNRCETQYSFESWLQDLELDGSLLRSYAQISEELDHAVRQLCELLNLPWPLTAADRQRLDEKKNLLNRVLFELDKRLAVEGRSAGYNVSIEIDDKRKELEEIEARFRETDLRFQEIMGLLKKIETATKKLLQIWIDSAVKVGKQIQDKLRAMNKTLLGARAAPPQANTRTREPRHGLDAD